MGKEKKEMDRFVVLAVFFVLFFFLITFKLIDLQIVHGEEYDQSSQNKVLKERDIKAPRGKILDRNGVPIAINREGFTVQVSKTAINTAQMNDMLLKLENVFKKNGDNYLCSFSKYVTVAPKGFNGRSITKFKKWMIGRDYFGLKDEDRKKAEKLSTVEDVFKFLRDVCFKIEPSYTDEQAYKIMTLKFEVLQNKWYFDTGNPILLASDVSDKTVAEVEERNHVFPGVSTDVVSMRKYIDADIISHVIGYIRPISSISSDEQLASLKEEGYRPNDVVGQAGIESKAERYLKGNDGKKRVEVDTNGRLTAELDSIPAQPGDDVFLTIDMNLQRVAEESLQKNIKLIAEAGKKGTGGRNNLGDANAGSVVAIDVNTGDVLAMANYPGYSPSMFLEGSQNKDAQQAIAKWLTDNENKPLRNRAIQDIYAPGSTFKPLTGIAALQEGVITPNYQVYDSGKMNIAGRDFYCLEYRNGMGAHGWLDLREALETSCNIYFHWVGYKTGIDKIDKWAKAFGLGEKTGINLDGENAGILSSKAYKKEAFPNDPVWRGADTAQSSIGQLYNKFTPLQLCNYIAAIANGGEKYTPHIIKRITKYDGSVANEIKPECTRIPVKPETLQAIKEGMVAVTHSVEGTAAKVFSNFPYKVAGKTGTAQTGLEATHSSNALFVCYAPADNPQIAVAVVVERGAWGSSVAPIARDVLAQYFGLNNTTTQTDSSIKTDEAVFQR